MIQKKMISITKVDPEHKLLDVNIVTCVIKGDGIPRENSAPFRISKLSLEDYLALVANCNTELKEKEYFEVSSDVCKEVLPKYFPNHPSNQRMQNINRNNYSPNVGRTNYRSRNFDQ